MRGISTQTVAAISYRQILLDRDGQPLGEPQVIALVQQVLQQLQPYHDRQQAHGDLSLASLYSTDQGCWLASPRQPDPHATPRQDLQALARAAITLLTGYPPHYLDASWQDRCPPEVTPWFKHMLQRMLMGEFDQAREARAALAPLTLAPTEVVPRPPTRLSLSPAWVFLLLGVSMGTLLGAGLLLFWLGRSRSLERIPPSPVVTSFPTPASGGGGQKAVMAPRPASPLEEQEALALIDNWLEAKKTVFAPPYDLDLAAQFLTGPAWQDVSKPNGSVDWLRQNQVSYRYGDRQVRLQRVLQATPEHMVLDVLVQEEFSLYRQGRLRQRKVNREVFRFDLRRVEGSWKIYDRRALR